jgi:hypothetical protein
MSSSPINSDRRIHAGRRLATRFGALLVALACAACSATPFPGNPASSGVRDVPFVDTYNFDFPSGSQDRGSKGGTDLSGNLRIYSAADLANLLSAANVSTQLSGGVVTGFTLSGATAIPSVLLDAQGFDGDDIPDVFYNGLGGVPDFVAVDGTADQGSFTIFNAPAGEVFIRASGGGRGLDHVGVFNQAISVKPLEVVPVIVAEIGVTGPITDWVTQENVFPVSVSALGLQGDSRFSDDRGLLQVTPIAGFRVVLPSSSLFSIKTEADGYVTTYQNMDTNLADLGDAVDLTRFIEMVSQNQVNAWFQQVGLTRTPGTGIVVGTFLAAQDTPRDGQRFRVVNVEGEPIGEAFYGKDPLLREGDPGWDARRTFVILNVPPGPVFIRSSGKVPTSGINETFVGASYADVLPDAVTLTSVRVSDNLVPDNPFSPVLATLRGTVVLSDLVTPVTDVVIDVAGFPGGPGAADGPIRSQTTFNGTEFRIQARDRSPPGQSDNHLDSNLTVGSSFFFRVGDLPGQSRYVDTYQPGNTFGPTLLPNGTQEVVGNLQVFTRTEVESMAAIAGVTLDPSAGILVGRIVDALTASTAGGIDLRVFDPNGDEVGELRYMDANGLPQRLGTTSSRGEFVAFNVPPGPVLVHVVSRDDTGSRTARVFTGGVTTLGTMFIGDAPPDKVAVSGTVRDLQDIPLGGVELTFEGEPAPDTGGDTGFLTQFSDGSGGFDVDLGISGRYIVATNPGPGFLPSYNMDLRTRLLPVEDATVRVVSQNHLTQIENAVIAAGGSLTQDPSLGIVAGRVNSRAWTDTGTAKTTITEGIRGPTAIAKALLNGDGLVDLIVANGDSDSVSVYFGLDDGTFTFAGNYPVGANPVDLVGLDVDGDAVGDILVLSQGAASGEVTVLLGTVRGVFREDPSRRLLVGNAPVSIALGDMDGDTFRDDVVVLNGGGGSPTVSVFYLNDERRFEPAPFSGTLLVGSNPSRLVVRDLDPIVDNAGRLNPILPVDDIVVVMEGSDAIESYRNIGTDLIRQVPTPLASGSGPTDVVRLDINGDRVAGEDRGLEDVVLNGAANTVQILKLTGNVLQEIAPHVDLDPGCGARHMALLETSGDSRLDLVVLCAGNGTVTVYLGTGNGFFVPWQCDSGCPRPAVPSGDEPLDLVSDLFDPIVGLDLAVVNRFSDSLAIFSGTPVPLAGVPVAVSDIDGNAVPDIYYLDGSGLPLSGGVTGPTGGFIAFNVPPGNMWVSSTAGENANRRVLVFPGAATYADLLVLPASPAAVTVQGQVSDAVVSPQTGIEVLFAGTGIGTVTADELAALGVYQLTLPSNQNDGVIRLRGQ